MEQRQMSKGRRRELKRTNPYECWHTWVGTVLASFIEQVQRKEKVRKWTKANCLYGKKIRVPSAILCSYLTFDYVASNIYIHRKVFLTKGPGLIVYFWGSVNITEQNVLIRVFRLQNQPIGVWRTNENWKQFEYKALCDIYSWWAYESAGVCTSIM